MNTENIFRKNKPLVFEKCKKKICLSHIFYIYIYFHIYINLVLFTIIQWNLPLEQVFKDAVADSVTTFCGESRDCEITAPRKRLLPSLSITKFFHQFRFASK